MSFDIKFLYSCIFTLEVLIGIIVKERILSFWDKQEYLKMKHLILVILFPMSLVCFFFELAVAALIWVFCESFISKKINSFLNKEIKASNTMKIEENYKKRYIWNSEKLKFEEKR